MCPGLEDVFWYFVKVKGAVWAKKITYPDSCSTGNLETSEGSVLGDLIHSESSCQVINVISRR